MRARVAERGGRVAPRVGELRRQKRGDAMRRGTVAQHRWRWDKPRRRKRRGSLMHHEHRCTWPRKEVRQRVSSGISLCVCVVNLFTTANFLRAPMRTFSRRCSHVSSVCVRRDRVGVRVPRSRCDRDTCSGRLRARDRGPSSPRRASQASGRAAGRSWAESYVARRTGPVPQRCRPTVRT